jgi:hypothetical protein
LTLSESAGSGDPSRRAGQNHLGGYCHGRQPGAKKFASKRLFAKTATLFASDMSQSHFFPDEEVLIIASMQLIPM